MEILATAIIVILLILMVTFITSLVESYRVPSITERKSGLLHDNNFFSYLIANKIATASRKIAHETQLLEYVESMLELNFISSKRSAIRYFNRKINTHQTLNAHFYRYFGLMYFFGYGVKKDSTKAMELIRIAIEKKDTRAHIAMFYILLRQNNHLAIAKEHLSFAADNNDELGQFIKAYCIRYKLYIDKTAFENDAATYLKLYESAASLKQPAALLSLAVFYSQYNHPNIKKNAELIEQALLFSLLCARMSSSKVVKDFSNTIMQSLTQETIATIEKQVQIIMFEEDLAFIKQLNKRFFAHLAG